MGETQSLVAMHCNQLIDRVAQQNVDTELSECVQRDDYAAAEQRLRVLAASSDATSPTVSSLNDFGASLVASVAVTGIEQLRSRL